MAASLPVLTFHTIDNQQTVISFPPCVFMRGIAKLYKRGHQTLSLMEATDFIRRGAPFPDHSFVITFDDGYQSVYEEAFPILKRYGMSATVFLTVGERGTVKPGGRLPSLTGRSMLSWHEIREMQRSGIDFGAHTYTHPYLTRLPFYLVKAEVCDSKAIIEDFLSTPVTCFAYPYGRYDPQIHEIVHQNFSKVYLGAQYPASDPASLSIQFRRVMDRPFRFCMITTYYPLDNLGGARKSTNFTCVKKNE